MLESVSQHQGKAMQKFFCLCCLCALLAAVPAAVWAANEKIDPDSYICAELVALASTESSGPLFEALQLDGHAAAALGQDVAVPAALAPLAMQVVGICQAHPTEKVATIWQNVRKQAVLPKGGPWQAEQVLCKTYTDNPDEGSGFPIWLDGYNRQKSGTTHSILENNESFQAFLKACAQNPEARMLDVLREQAKQ